MARVNGAIARETIGWIDWFSFHNKTNFKYLKSKIDDRGKKSNKRTNESKTRQKAGSASEIDENTCYAPMLVRLPAGEKPIQVELCKHLRATTIMISKKQKTKPNEMIRTKLMFTD